MNRKRFAVILLVSLVCISTWLGARRSARSSIFGRWHEVGASGEELTFTGNGEVYVGSSPGSYTWVDDEHVRVEFGMGSPRLVWFPPRTGDMMWTNHELGLVLRYTNEPGSSAKVRISKALGI
jgi:hypothetical protein